MSRSHLGIPGRSRRRTRSLMSHLFIQVDLRATCGDDIIDLLINALYEGCENDRKSPFDRPTEVWPVNDAGPHLSNHRIRQPRFIVTRTRARCYSKSILSSTSGLAGRQYDKHASNYNEQRRKIRYNSVPQVRYCTPLVVHSLSCQSQLTACRSLRFPFVPVEPVP